MTFNVVEQDFRLSGKNSENPETQSVRSYAVRLHGKDSEELTRPKEESVNDKSSPDARKAERVRRDQIRDSINALDEAQQDEAREAESQRRQVWDRCDKERKCKANREGTGKKKPQADGHDLSNSQPQWWKKIILWTRVKGGGLKGQSYLETIMPITTRERLNIAPSTTIPQEGWVTDYPLDDSLDFLRDNNS